MADQSLSEVDQLQLSVKQSNQVRLGPSKKKKPRPRLRKANGKTGVTPPPPGPSPPPAVPSPTRRNRPRVLCEGPRKTRLRVPRWTWKIGVRSVVVPGGPGRLPRVGKLRPERSSPNFSVPRDRPRGHPSHPGARRPFVLVLSRPNSGSSGGRMDQLE